MLGFGAGAGEEGEDDAEDDDDEAGDDADLVERNDGEAPADVFGIGHFGDGVDVVVDLGESVGLEVDHAEGGSEADDEEDADLQAVACGVGKAARDEGAEADDGPEEGEGEREGHAVHEGLGGVDGPDGAGDAGGDDGQHGIVAQPADHEEGGGELGSDQADDLARHGRRERRTGRRSERSGLRT